MKISVIYHSETGNTKRIAELIVEGANRSSLINAKAMSINEVDHSFLLDSKAVLIGSPTYTGGYSWQMKKWLDTKYTKGQLKGKLASVFSTANSFGEGAEVAEIGLISNLLLKGLLIYTGGNCDGELSTHLGVVAVKDGIEFQQERARIFGERIAKKAMELFLCDK
jgi:NAD(P)H dehydrogenase (quinone)